MNHQEKNQQGNQDHCQAIFTSAKPETISKSMLTLGSTIDIDDCYSWIIDPEILLGLYSVASEHARCIQLKANGAFGLGLKNPNEKLDALTNHGFADLCVSLAQDQEALGNAFLQVVKAGNEITSLIRLPAGTMKVKQDGGYFQRCILKNEWQEKDFKEEQIIHLRPACVYGWHYSIPSWIGCRTILDLIQEIISYNRKYFANSAIPDLAVIFKNSRASKEQVAELTTFFNNSYRGLDNSHKTMVLDTATDGDIKFEKLSESVKDGDFLKLLDAIRDRIAIAHGVPPRMLGIMSAGQLGGGGEVDSQMQLFETHTLSPIRRRMLDQLKPLMNQLGVEKTEFITSLPDVEKKESDDQLVKSILKSL